jgi:hypothetical protein
VPDTISSRVRIAAVAGVVAIGLVVAGCGGGGSSTTSGATGASGASGATGATPLSKDEFVSQANAICKESNDKIAAMKAPASNQLSDVQAAIKEELPVEQETYDKFTALTPPTELQAQFDQLAAAAKAQIALAQQLINANNADEANAIIAKAKTLGNKADSAAQSIGLTECAKDVSPQG